MAALMGRYLRYFLVPTDLIDHVLWCTSHSFSRKILWLRVSPTNHNPRVIVRFFLECVEKLAGKFKPIFKQQTNNIHCSYYISIGCPRVVRSDYGTENVKLAAVQIAFRLHHCDLRSGERSFLYGPSPANVVTFLRSGYNICAYITSDFLSFCNRG